ncbi:myb-binding protein 1A-like protein [Neodiprion lecontei]|uniref:Myb-binding protein 1A-like protein n=1 Tax=Neodiprion lecontei TaxID=441921 RepID=A0A6J0BQW0_NEOLC|nr:myb-binding protein 1A-like protein [Neodiprion lecontei]
MEDNHMAEDNLPTIKQKAGPTILDSFDKLAGPKENQRIEGAIVLLRHLLQRDSDETHHKELQYALTRLVRGMGTSRADARSGFFTALTTFLSMNSENEVGRILELINSNLHTVERNSKSEQTDVWTGQILVCGALIHSKILLTATLEKQQQVIELLLTAGQKRSYLPFASYSFLIDLIEQLEEKDFKTIVWPILEKELSKPWNEQTLDTFHVLLVISKRYPSIIRRTSLKQYLHSKEIIDKNSITPISALLMEIPMLVCLRNPVYKLFCERLTSTEHVSNFWDLIDQYLAKPTRNKMLVAIEIATFIILNIKDATVIPSLITPNFLQNVLKTVEINRKKPKDEVVVKFRKLLELLVLAMKRDDIQSGTRIALLEKLLLYPGDLLIEKKTSTKVVQMLTTNLNSEGVKKLSEIYKDITAACKPKEKSDFPVAWINKERIYAAQMMTRLIDHSAINAEHEWKLEQLKFLFQLGLCQTPTVGMELAASLKESFYRALDLKLAKLNDLRSILSSLVHYIDSKVFSKKKLELRTPLTEAATNVWKEMMAMIKKLENNPEIEQAVPIFHTMELHMGLQLFSEPEMGINSIQELHSCFERIERKTKKKSEEEPEWVEVVVDLMLSLLSRSSHLLRSLVGCVFPHICPMLTASSIHQILDILDPKNNTNPLSLKKDDDSSSDESSEDEDTVENGDVEEEEDQDEESIETGEEENSDSDSENYSDEEEDEDDTVNDKLRMAVQQALGNAMAETDDEDIDVDQINEEEGHQLDSALANAFKLLRESRRNKKKKPGKNAQALTHFRVRVVDLLEIYLDSNPSMALTLNILLPLVALLEFSIKDQHQKPLQHRVRSCLKRLSNVKKFSSIDDVTSDLLADILRALIDKGSRSAPVYHEMGDKLTESCTFLVRCSQQISAKDDQIQNIYTEILRTFFKKRDCVLPPMLFKSVLNLQWIGNWQLAPLLVEFAFDNEIRPFRRNQALELLDIFYHNNRLIQTDRSHAKIRKVMETNISHKSVELLEELGQNKNTEATHRVKQKFVYLLFTLLHTIKHQHQSSFCDWEAVGTTMAIYRSKSSLAKDAKRAYNRLANQLGVEVNTIQNQKKEEKIESCEHAESNGHNVETGSTDDDKSSEDSKERDKQTKKLNKKKQKNKSKQKDIQQLKKVTRELRMKAMSDGFSSVDFSAVPVHYINDVDMEITADGESSRNCEVLAINMLQNSTDLQSGKRVSPKKRSASESQNIPFKTSKKKK